MNRTTVFFTLLCTLLLSGRTTFGQSEDSESRDEIKQLTIGDKMPAISDRVTWLKGDEVESFEAGKIYVIDLWATWCGPCIAMMPHTSDIADKYAKFDVTVVGLALDPRGATPTEEFVEKNNEKMRYVVCEDIDGQMKDEYMARTGTAGIPTVLIVNREGTLAWIGHPKNMGGPLAEIVLGTYDLAAAKMERKYGSASSSAGRQPSSSASSSSNVHQMIAKLFEAADKNDDGLLTADELANTRDEASGRIMFAPGRIASMDSDGDDALSREEIEEAFKRRSRSGRGGPARGSNRGAQSRDRVPAGDRGAQRSRPGFDRGGLGTAFASRDGEAIVEVAESLMGDSSRLVNALGIKAKGLYFQGKFAEAEQTFKSILSEEGEFKTQVLCGAAEFLAVEYEDNPDRNLKLAVTIAEAAVANEGGQAWPATGSLVFVLDVVDFYVQGNPKEDIHEYEFFVEKLAEHKELRDARPDESHVTSRNREQVLGK